MLSFAFPLFNLTYIVLIHPLLEAKIHSEVFSKQDIQLKSPLKL